MYTCFRHALPRVVINRTQEVKKKWKLRQRLRKTVSHQRCLGQDYKKRTPVTECLVCCVCVLLRMGSCVRFCCHNILFSHTKCGESAPLSEFRCCREIPLANQKLTCNKRVSCITRHDDFSPRRCRAVSLRVAPFLRDCKGRGYRRRASQTESEWVYSHLIQVCPK